MSKGFILVISAPSGCGKTTILRKVMGDLPGLVFSVSHTTRPPRPGEENGRDYHFVTREQFIAIRDREPSGFLEWAEVHGNFYGTGRDEVVARLEQGLDVVLDIDVQGARPGRTAQLAFHPLDLLLDGLHLLARLVDALQRQGQTHLLFLALPAPEPQNVLQPESKPRHPYLTPCVSSTLGSWRPAWDRPPS